MSKSADHRPGVALPIQGLTDVPPRGRGFPRKGLPASIAFSNLAAGFGPAPVFRPAWRDRAALVLAASFSKRRHGVYKYKSVYSILMSLWKIRII